MRKLIIYILFFICLFSCEEETDWNLASIVIPRLVVDGMITNQRGRQEVTLTLPVKNINDIPVPVSGAFVAITDQEKVYFLTEIIEKPGTYVTADTVQGVVGKIYTLYIRIAEFEFVANSYMVPVEPLKNPFIVPCDKQENFYHLIPESEGDPFMMFIFINWINTPFCKDDHSCHERINHYHLNSIDVNEFFKPDKEIICFPSGSQIIRRKFSLNPDHQRFIRSMLMETEWRGGIFDVQRGNILSNMSPGAIGYFAASTVVTDTLYIE